MKIQVQLDTDTGSITIHAGLSPTLAPARAAAALAGAAEAALASLTTPSPTTNVPTDVPTDDDVADDVVIDVAAEVQAIEPAAVEPAQAELADIAPADVESAQVGAWRDAREEQLRATAMGLLDEGLDDVAVCRRLGISRARLLSWDDPAGEHIVLSTQLTPSLRASAFATAAGGAR